MTLKNFSWMRWILPILLCCAGCGRPATIEAPLVDSRHRPMILTESRALRLPNTPPGTRFVRGWRFAENSDGLNFRPYGSTASLEIVQIAGRERNLVLEFAEGLGGAGGVVSARSSDLNLGSFELPKNVVIPLPADLGPGRVPIELEFSRTVDIVGVSLSKAAPRGQIEFDGTDVIQSGWSAIDFLRWVNDDARLVGELELPPVISPDQKFTVVIDRGDGEAREAFEIGSLVSKGAGEVERVDIPLAAPGLVRIRLMAEGRGPAGRWRDLRWSPGEDRRRLKLTRSQTRRSSWCSMSSMRCEPTTSAISARRLGRAHASICSPLEALPSRTTFRWRPTPDRLPDRFSRAMDSSRDASFPRRGPKLWLKCTRRLGL